MMLNWVNLISPDLQFDYCSNCRNQSLNKSNNLHLQQPWHVSRQDGLVTIPASGLPIEVPWQVPSGLWLVSSLAPQHPISWGRWQVVCSRETWRRKSSVVKLEASRMQVNGGSNRYQVQFKGMVNGSVQKLGMTWNKGFLNLSDNWLSFSVSQRKKLVTIKLFGSSTLFQVET